MSRKLFDSVIVVAAISLGACSGPTNTSVPASAARSLGPLLRSIQPDNAPRAAGKWPAGRAQLLFVSDVKRNRITIYDSSTINPRPIGNVTDGLSRPVGLAVDTAGDLFAVNNKTNTIVEYMKGQTEPAFTISNGLDSPYGIAIDDSNDVFATNTANYTVVGYKPGTKAPFETIDFSQAGQPVGLNFDSHGNLWVACDAAVYYTGGAVFEVPAGTTAVVYAGLTGLEGPIGIALGPDDVMYVSNWTYPHQPFVSIYPYGSKSPKAEIVSGLRSPLLNAFTKTGAFFQVNDIVQNVLGYKPNEYAPFSTISGYKIKIPLGITAWPRIH